MSTTNSTNELDNLPVSNVCRRCLKKGFEPSSKESQHVGRLPEVALAMN